MFGIGLLDLCKGYLTVTKSDTSLKSEVVNILMYG